MEDDMAEHKKWIQKKSDLWSIPNILGYFRLALIPVFAWIYMHADTAAENFAAACVIGVSGLTDMFDGKIARHFNMITELGKLIDPVADKATFGVILICMTIKHPWMLTVVILFLLKEGFMAVMGLLLLKKNGRKLDGAMWYGKVCTAALYVIIVLIMLFPQMGGSVINGLIAAGAVIMAATWAMYIPVFYKMWHSGPER